jgi:hypothetical protein
MFLQSLLIRLSSECFQASNKQYEVLVDNRRCGNAPIDSSTRNGSPEDVSPVILSSKPNSIMNAILFIK